MPSQTKQIIIDAFLRLAAQRPFEKITVRDVVDACGINRNTFYYHFRDIYAVVEGLCAQAVDGLPQAESVESLITVFVKGAFSFSAQHPKAAHRLALSLGRDGVERCFAATDLDQKIAAALQATHTEEKDLHFFRVAALFLRHAVIGLFLDVLHSKKEPDRERLALEIGRLCALFDGEKSENNQEKEGDP